MLGELLVIERADADERLAVWRDDTVLAHVPRRIHDQKISRSLVARKGHDDL